MCIDAKQSKAPCSGRLAKENKNNVFHSDSIGLFQELVAVGVLRYILTFTVERSRFAKLFVIKDRSVVYDWFRVQGMAVVSFIRSPEAVYFDKTKNMYVLEIYQNRRHSFYSLSL